MLSRFFNKTVVVRRLRTTSGTKKAIQATATVDCTYQNIDPVEQNSLEGIASKTYRAYFDQASDVQEGDILTDQDSGKKFKVLGIEVLGSEYGLQSEHLEVTMQKYTG